MSELKVLQKPNPDKKVYLCRHCRWSGFEPKQHTFGGGGYWFTHVLCPNCNALFRQTDNLRGDNQ